MKCNMLLIPTEIYQYLSVEFNFEDKPNTSSVFLSSFDLNQHYLIEQILFLLQ